VGPPPALLFPPDTPNAAGAVVGFVNLDLSTDLLQAKMHPVPGNRRAEYLEVSVHGFTTDAGQNRSLGGIDVQAETHHYFVLGSSA
jgi:hypothetical protein